MKANTPNRIEQLTELVSESLATAADIINVIRQAEMRGLTVELFGRVSGTLASTKQGMERMQREMIDDEERDLLTTEWFERYRQLCNAEKTLATLKPTHGLN